MNLNEDGSAPEERDEVTPEADLKDATPGALEQEVPDFDDTEPVTPEDGDALEDSDEASEIATALAQGDASGRRYFDDDELAMKLEDELPESEIVRQEATMAFLRSSDNHIIWSIEGMQDERGKNYTRRQMLSQPLPVFRIKDGTGAEAEFEVTEDLANTLAHGFDSLARAYRNVEPKRLKRSQVEGSPENASAEDLVQSVTQWVTNNWLELLIPFILALMIIYVVVR